MEQDAGHVNNVHETLVASHGLLKSERPVRGGLTYASRLSSGVTHSLKQYRDLFIKRKLRNAMVSTCVVALAQQLCGSKSFLLVAFSTRKNLGRMG